MRTFSPRRRPARRNLRAFAHGTRGSISVEYALWTTMFGVAFTLIADLTSVFTANTEMWHVGQDAARRLSVAEMGVQEAESFVRDALAPRFGPSRRPPLPRFGAPVIRNGTGLARTPF